MIPHPASGPDPNPHPRRRHTLRWRDASYAVPRAYFVTICTHGKRHTLGCVRGGAFHPTPLGRIVSEELARTGERASLVTLAEQVMPNHLHVLVRIIDEARPTRCDGNVEFAFMRPGDQRAVLGGPEPGSISTAMRAFKGAVTRRARAELGWSDQPIWQRGFHDRVILGRRRELLHRIRSYIRKNPRMWRADPFNSEADRQPEFDDDWAI